MVDVPKTAMNLELPTVNADEGQWGITLNGSDVFEKIGNHTHTGSGDGYQLTQDSLAIDDNLTLNSNNLTDVRAVSFDVQLAPITVSEEGIVYTVGNELYYNDRNGHAIPITNNGVVNNGGSGGTSYVEETLTANTTISAGSATNFYLLNSSGGQFTITLPQAADAGTKGMWMKDIGGLLGTNDVLLATAGGDTFVDHGLFTNLIRLKLPLGSYQVVSDGVDKWMILVLATFQNNLGNYDMAGTLNVDGDVTMGSDLTVDGYGHFSGFLDVDGVADFSGDYLVVHSGTDLHVVGASSGAGPAVSWGSDGLRNGSFVSYFESTFYEPVEINDQLVVQDTLVTNGSIVANGTVLFNDTVQFNAAATFSDPVTFNDDAEFNGNVTLGSGSGDTITALGDVDLRNDVTIGSSSADNFTINSITTINEDFTAEGATFNGAVVVDDNFTTNGNVILSNGGGATAVMKNITSWSGTGNRPLFNWTTAAPSSNLDVDIGNKFVKVTGGAGGINITYDIGKVGDWMVVANDRSSGVLEVTANSGSIFLSLNVHRAAILIHNSTSLTSGWVVFCYWDILT